MINIKHLWKGCLFSLLLAVPAWYLGKTFPLIGGPVFGILLGMIIAFWKRPCKCATWSMPAQTTPMLG